MRIRARSHPTATCKPEAKLNAIPLSPEGADRDPERAAQVPRH